VRSFDLAADEPLARERERKSNEKFTPNKQGLSS